MKKNGTTSAGTTRYRCPTCNASTTPKRPTSTRRHELTTFLTWLHSTQTRDAFATSTRTFTRHTHWCWNITPTPHPTGEIHDQIMLDGTYFNGWCILIAYTGTHVIDWQLTDGEKRASWDALLTRIPAPTYAIVDGNGPLSSSIRAHWPDTKIQRCHFHIRHAAHTHLTRTPHHPMNKALLALFKALATISTLDEAAAWSAQFASWEAGWASTLKHRTYPRPGVTRPSWATATQKWWFTHRRTRRAWKLLAGLIEREEIFTWLTAHHHGVKIARTTNALEGGPNRAIKEMLRLHRGLSDTHATKAVAWMLWSKTLNPGDPWALVTKAHYTPKRPQPAVEDEQIGPAVYDRAFSPEEGISIRKGWGGRSR